MEVVWNQYHTAERGLRNCGEDLRRNLRGGRNWDESLEALWEGAALVPNFVEFGGLVDTSAVDEDPVGCREVGIDSPVLFENATEFLNLSFAGAGCIRSMPEGALDLTPAPSDSLSALVPSPCERRRTTGSHERLVAGGLAVAGRF